MEKDVYKEIDELEKNFFWYIIRREIVVKVVKKLSKNNRDAFLDLGCGTGENLKNFKFFFSKSFGLDISRDAINFARKKNTDIRFIKGDATNIPFKDNTFSLVTALDLIEHLENDILALKEIRRILKRGGYLFLTVPAYKWLWSEFDKRVMHKRRYSKKEICSKIRKSGLKVIFASYLFFLSFPFLMILRFKEKTSKKEKTFRFSTKINRILNKIFYLILKFEYSFFLALPFLFGSSILVVAVKD